MAKAFTNVQLNFIANGIAEGLDHAVICDNTDLSDARLKRVLEGEIPKNELAVYDKYLTQAKQRTALAKVKHYAEISAMAGDAYQVMKDALHSFEKNPQLAYQVARDVLKDADAPVHENKVHHDAPLTQINIGMEAKGAKALDTAINSIEVLTSQIAGRPLGLVGAPSRHIHISESDVVGETNRTPKPEPKERTVTEGTPIEDSSDDT